MKEIVNEVKILFVARQSGLGGTERRLSDLAKYLNKNDYNAKVYFTIQTNLLKTESLKKEKNETIFRFIRLFKMIKHFKPNLIQSFDLESGLYVKLICFLLRLKVPLISGHGAERIIDSRSEFLIRKKLFLSNMYICNSIKAVNSIKSAIGNSREVICIENGLDEERLLGEISEFEGIINCISNKVVIGYIGKMDRFKHGERMLDLAVLFFENYKGIKEINFVIIGDGPNKIEMDIKWNSLKSEIKEKILIFPALKDAGKLARFFSIGVLCSDSEGFPNVLLEYMFFGVPWVSTNVGDVSKILDYGKAGTIIPSWNIDKFALALENLINDESLYKELKLNGPKIFKENYSLEKMGRKYTEVYKRERNKYGQ
jgi:glycosyltransferase involved in cell wall biosynthesis